jgi:hemolysin activation/secretion protein
MKKFFPSLSTLSALFAVSVLLSILSITARGQAVSGQAFKNIAPKQPAKNEPGQVLNEASEKNAANSHGGDTVVVDHLKGVVLLSNPKQVRLGGVSGKSGIDLGDITFAHSADLTATINPYLGQRVTLNSLSEMTRSIVAYYRDHDRPVVNVYVPQQDAASGVIQIVVLESHVEKVSATGARFFSNDMLRHEVDLRPGDPLTSSEMRDDVDWINRNPFLQSDLLLAPGDLPGTTDVLLRTRDRFPLRVYAGYEDSGTAQTGFDRYLAGFNYGNFLGLGQQLNYQYTTSGDGESLQAHSGSYVIPLPWHNTLTFFGSYVDTKGSIPPLIGLNGRSYQISGRYSIPLPTLTFGSDLVYKHDFAVGFDYKYNDNSLEFGGESVPGSLYDIDQFVVSYNGALTDPYGQTTVDDELYVSPGNWGGNNNDAAFDTNHPGASSDYVYNTLVAQRLTKLPADFTLLLRGTLQTSNGNLAQSEQLGFGGYDTVRGYDEREVNADEGYIFTTELRTPPVSLGDTFKCAAFKDQLQFLGFWDYAAAHNHSPLPGEPSEIPLSSVGVGVRYTINTYLSVRYDYGFQLLRTGLDNDHGNRSDLGIVVSY